MRRSNRANVYHANLYKVLRVHASTLFEIHQSYQRFAGIFLKLYRLITGRKVHGKNLLIEVGLACFLSRDEITFVERSKREESHEG